MIDLDRFAREGFAVVAAPPSLDSHVGEAYALWRTILGSNPRKQALRSDLVRPDGWFPMCVPAGCELKESFYLNADTPLPPEASAASWAVVRDLLSVAASVAREIELCSPGAVRDTGSGCLRILRYPAFEGDPESNLVEQLARGGAQRSAPHTDLNSLAIIPYATAPGLEALGKDRQWRAIEVPRGSVAVQAGRELEARSRGRFSALVHRVRNPHGAERSVTRMAMAMFVS